MKSLVISAWLVWGTVSLAQAQLVQEHTADASAHSFASFQLTPTQPAYSRTLLIDPSPRVVVKVAALSKDLVIRLTAPNGTTIHSIGEAESATFESVVTIHPTIEGANYTALLHNPAPGAWRVSVTHNGSLNRTIDGFITSILQSPIVMALVVPDETYPLHGHVSAGIAVFDGPTRVKGLTVTATIVDPSRAESPIVFKDDGIDPDAVANDGQYSLRTRVMMPGQHDIYATVAGTSGTKRFERSGHRRFNVVRQTATIADTFTETIVDENADGIWDKLLVTPRVKVEEAGTYNLSVVLKSSAKGDTHSVFRGTLNPGDHDATVVFTADQMTRDLMVNGPYDIGDMYLMQEKAEEHVVVDRRLLLGRTGPHDVGKFTRTVQLVRSVGSAFGVDTNGNGLFDKIRVTHAVYNEGNEKDWYTIKATLYDPSGAVVAVTRHDHGRTIRLVPFGLDFDGRAIAAAGRNGPYRLALHVVGSRSGFYDPSALTTPAWTVSQFETDCVRLLVEQVHAAISMKVADPATPPAMKDKIEDALPLLQKFGVEWNKTPSDFIAALGALEGAAGDLEGAGYRETTEPWLRSIAGAAERVAMSAIAASEGDPNADAGKLNSAKMKLQEGRTRLMQLKFKDGVAEFRAALSEALSASPRRMPHC